MFKNKYIMSVKGFASGKHHTHVNVYFVSRILSNSFPECCSQSLVVNFVVTVVWFGRRKKISEDFRI